VDPIEDRLDPVERILSLDVELAGQRNAEADFDGPAEGRRQGEVVDRRGRDRNQDDEEGDPDRKHLSPTSRRGGRRLRLNWFRHLSTTRPCLIAGRRSVLREDQSAIRLLLDPAPWNSQGGLSYFGVHVGSVWACSCAAARRFAHSPIGVGSTAVPIITAMAIGRRSPVTPIVTPYCAMMREISARGIRNAASGQTASARTPAARGRIRRPGTNFAAAATPVAARDRGRTPAMVQGLIRNPMLAKKTPMKTAATGVMWRETRGPYSVLATMLPAKNAPTRGGRPRTAKAKLMRTPKDRAAMITLLGETESVALKTGGRAWLPTKTRKVARPRTPRSPASTYSGGSGDGDARPTTNVISDRATMSSISIEAVMRSAPRTAP